MTKTFKPSPIKYKYWIAVAPIAYNDTPILVLVYLYQCRYLTYFYHYYFIITTQPGTYLTIFKETKNTAQSYKKVLNLKNDFYNKMNNDLKKKRGGIWLRKNYIKPDWR